MTIKETIPFNFDDIYTYIENKFEEEGYDTQEGSNTMQLVTSMSYLVSMLNANTAANINETILTLARKRNIALKDARVLGYEIDHIKSYQYEITLEFSNPGSYRINKHDSFTSGDKKYYYFGETTDIFEVTEGNPVTKKIIVKEGTLKTYSEEPTLNLILGSKFDETTGTSSVQDYIDIPFTNVENDGIEMFLTYYDEDGNFRELEEWDRSESYMLEADLQIDYKFVRLDIPDYGTPRCYYKIGDVGKSMRIGTLVYINILVSSGSEGEMTDTPTDDNGDAIITNYTLSSEGADEEDLESIKSNAPIFNNTANRVITNNDYKVFCNRQSSVSTSSIWDGTDEIPTRAGNIWFSFIPATRTRELDDSVDSGYVWNLTDEYYTSNWYIEDDEIQEVYDVLDGFKIPTLRFLHRHPIYMDFEYTVDIPRYTITTSESDINTGVFDVINTYFESGDSLSDVPVETFGFEYFHSNLLKRIDSQLTENMGCNVTLNTSINLHEKLVVTETFEDGAIDYNKIIVHLGIPYDGVFDSDDITVRFDSLPSINTEDFIDGNRRLYVDEGSYSFTESTEMTTYDIKLSEASSENDTENDDIIGTFRVFPKSSDDIEIILFVTSDDGYNTGINPDDLVIDIPNQYGLNLDIKYKNDNVPIIRNTIPRLKQVQFT